MRSVGAPLLLAGGGFHTLSPVFGEAPSRPRGVLPDGHVGEAADDLRNAHGFYTTPLARIAAEAASRNAVAAPASSKETRSW